MSTLTKLSADGEVAWYHTYTLGTLSDVIATPDGGFAFIGHSNDFTPSGQDIEYKIRFQNTGTDTAFNVKIIDTLSQYLDITTIRPGASSHVYEFTISGEGILQFQFNNIMLPDSNVNEAASHGFVKFKIAQKDDLGLETKIYNDAAIYFDFNLPIITNTTLHTIGEELVLVSVDQILVASTATEVKVYPNPFSVSARIEIEGKSIDQGMFKLYDVTGRLLKKQVFNSNTFTINKNDLQAGIYFFTIENNGQRISSGNLSTL